ncbi:unnamed protein product (macronuclear) [Paramecium tetraurelia]|uniref:Uncharacterized protein n=1 Tax=Paramecium tetraurelia TaxID=5888 RepID=A0CSW7_PARTE|nr:uncharacterized protein GSPATT00010156001 [Paramecium tetraurelia]CAK73884.1 unnamed protein product [Paramecium tetraurelia]|eukprot:XP_001441281.1 hypothetical protein (macronuclear) [Paramecium tetraurelia strain d4-2]
MKKLLIVSGLTGSGKSQLVQLLGEQLKTIVIPVDSLQIYKNWPISSNWPKKIDNYELIGKYDGLKQTITSYHYKMEVMEILKQRDNAILEGGCCFFMNYLLNSRKEQFEENQIKAADLEASKLLENCRDPQALLKEHFKNYDDSINSSDRYRIQKALRFALLTKGESITSPFNQDDPRLCDEMDIRGFFFTEPQENISKKIYARCDEMIRQGVIEEFYQFYQMQHQKEFRVTTPLGYDEFVNLLKCFQSILEGRYISNKRAEKQKREYVLKFIQQFYIKSRQYAAYQRKYFRSNLNSFLWIDNRTLNIPQLILQYYNCDRQEYESKVASPQNEQLKKELSSKLLGKQNDPIPSKDIQEIVYRTVDGIIEQ